jgi:hypothetical protein
MGHISKFSALLYFYELLFGFNKKNFVFIER